MRKVSVRNKVAVVLLLMSVLLTATTYAIQKLVVLPSFTTLERAAAKQDLERCLNAIQWDLESLSATCQ